MPEDAGKPSPDKRPGEPPKKPEVDDAVTPKESRTDPSAKQLETMGLRLAKIRKAVGAGMDVDDADWEKTTLGRKRLRQWANEILTLEGVSDPTEREKYVPFVIAYSSDKLKKSDEVKGIRGLDEVSGVRRVAEIAEGGDRTLSTADGHRLDPELVDESAAADARKTYSWLKSDTAAPPAVEVERAHREVSGEVSRGGDAAKAARDHLRRLREFAEKRG